MDQTFVERNKEEITELVILYFDNTSAINISKNPMMHAKTKHIATKYHYVRELVEDKQVKIEYIHSKEQMTLTYTTRGVKSLS